MVRCAFARGDQGLKHPLERGQLDADHGGNALRDLHGAFFALELLLGEGRLEGCHPHLFVKEGPHLLFRHLSWTAFSSSCTCRGGTLESPVSPFFWRIVSRYWKNTATYDQNDVRWVGAKIEIGSTRLHLFLRNVGGLQLQDDFLPHVNPQS